MREAIENLLEEAYELRSNASGLLKQGDGKLDRIDGLARLAILNFMIGRLKEVLSNAREHTPEHHIPTKKVT